MWWRKSRLWLESWCVWLAITSLIWTISLMIVTAVGGSRWVALPGPLEQLATGAALGALVGLTQQLLLGPKTRSAALWIAASAAGCLVGLEGMAPLARLLPGEPGLWLGSLLGGASLGLAQFGALHRTHWRTSWLAMTVAGWILAMVTGSLAAPAAAEIATVTSWAVTWSIGGTILMVVAVVALVVLFPHRRGATGEERLIWRR